MIQSTNIRYAYFDGDNIGSAIEHLLNSGKESEATHLSESIKRALFQIESYMEGHKDVELLMLGGDDILIKYDDTKHSLKLLEEVMEIFFKQTGLSMSCGVGANVSQAIGNLSSVKSSSKGTIKQPNTALDHTEYPQKSAKLFIFTTSDIPDPYINAMIHCMVHQPPLTQVILVGIINDRRKTEQQKQALENLKKRLVEQVKRLCEGKYLTKKDGEEKEVEIFVQQSDRQIYAQLLHLKLDVQAIPYKDLEKDLALILNEMESYRCVFDVTAVLKTHLIDIYTILRFRNITSIYYFELFNRRTYDDKELIHNLDYEKNYDYVRMSESLYTRDKMIISNSSVVTETEYNKIATAFSYIENNRNQLEEDMSNNFAKTGVLAYFIVGAGLFYLLYRYKEITSPDGWTWLEPRVWVFGILFFLLQHLIQGIFAQSFPSLNPANLFRTLKTWKKKKLLKKRTEQLIKQ